MDNKQQYINKYLNELCDKFKAIAILNLLALAKSDFEAVANYHENLVEIDEIIINYIKKHYSNEIIQDLTNNNLENIPKTMYGVFSWNTYKSILSEAYVSNLHNFRYKNQKLLLNKMAFEIDSSSETPILNMAVILNTQKKYAESIKLFSLVEKLSNVRPTLLIMGKAYEKAGRYDMALECYHRISTLEKGDSSISEIINELCYKVLKDV